MCQTLIFKLWQYQMKCDCGILKIVEFLAANFLQFVVSCRGAFKYYVQGALKPGSVGALLPGNLLSHRKFEEKLGNNARNFLSPQSVVTFLLLF